MTLKRSLAILAMMAMLSGCAHTTSYGGMFGGAPAGSITALEEMTLGGVKQWVLMRGKKASNPVVLFIHGGPGHAEMPMIRKHFEPLEDDFVVVTYDQRGAGKSYSPRIPKESMTHDQMVADAHELVLKLRQRFGVEKVHLVAHSWGTITGTLLAQRYPELFHDYVGVAQWTDGEVRERTSYNLILDWAKRTRNKDAIRQLDEIGPPPFSGPKAEDKLVAQKEWLVKSGGFLYGQDNMNSLFMTVLWSGEYSLSNKLNLLNGIMFSTGAMWADSMKVDLTRKVPELKVPVYFVAGRHDYNTPLPLIEGYYHNLKAPSKQLVIFEKSAHSPYFEEPEAFIRFMRETVKAGS